MAKLKKGSKAAKAFMAKIRKMRKNPGKKRAAKKRASKSKYKTKHIQAASKFAKGSIRTVKRGKVRVRVGCPKGRYAKRSGKCKVGTRAVSILTPKNPRKNVWRVIVKKIGEGGKVLSRGFWTGHNWQTSYATSYPFHDKDTALKFAKKMRDEHDGKRLVFGISDE